MATIVFKPGLGVDPAKGLGPGLSQPGKLEKKIFEVLIFYIKKLKNNSCGYMLYML
jgi:hypothetical protein